jgi:hypothetical protein
MKGISMTSPVLAVDPTTASATVKLHAAEGAWNPHDTSKSPPSDDASFGPRPDGARDAALPVE